MQKLRPYIVPGLFVFHLVVLCVMLATAAPFGNSHYSAPLDRLQNSAVWVALFSQFFLTALFAGLGPGSWALRIPSWGALAALDWFGLVSFYVVRFGPEFQFESSKSMFLFLPLGAWAGLVALLLLLRVIPYVKWRITLQPMSPTILSSQPRPDSLTRSILITVATWASVLVLLKDSLLWSEVGTNSKVENTVGGVFLSLFALLVTMPAVSLTLTRFADWMFYRRRWTIPLLASAAVGAAPFLIFGNAAPFLLPGSSFQESEIPLIVLWSLLALATQPLTTLLVIGMAGYRLSPHHFRLPAASEPVSQAAKSTTEESVGNWLTKLHRAHIAAPGAVVVFWAWIVISGVWNEHSIRTLLGNFTRSETGDISHLALNSAITDAGLAHLKKLPKLESVSFSNTNITDAKLAHLKELANLKTIDFRNTAITDAGVKELKSLTDLKKLDIGFHNNSSDQVVEQLAQLKSLTNLNRLSLSWTNVTDAGLVQLKGLTNLRELDLSFTRVTDAGLVHLKGLTKLKTLFLGGKNITDAGLVHLKEMTNLQKLTLRGTKITDAGVAELQKALPNCKIEK